MTFKLILPIVALAGCATAPPPGRLVWDGLNPLRRENDGAYQIADTIATSATAASDQASA
jgi:hypothetical protein